MTTIATDGLSMAGDTLCSNGQVFGFADKVRRAPDGRVYGACGVSAQCIKFERWMEEGGEQPTFKENFSALILNVDGTIDWFDEDRELVRLMAPAAIGSGAEFAIGAMEAGVSPERAVEIAAKRDTGTGGAVTILHIERKLEAVA